MAVASQLRALPNAGPSGAGGTTSLPDAATAAKRRSAVQTW